MRSVFFLAFLCLSLLSLVNGQLGLQQPIPRSVNEQRFRPTTNSQSAADYCGGQQMADAKSSVFTNSPETSINTIFNNVPAGDNPRIVISMVQYFLNGTQANGNPRYYNRVTVLSNETAVLRAGTNQRYYKPMSIPERFAGCGTDDSTRCVLRWVYDNSMSTNQDSRISCADVVVRSRSDDARVTITIGLTGGEKPIQPNTALNRLLGSTWATATDRLIDIYTSPDDATLSLSNQIRLDAEPVTSNDDGSYTIAYVFSGTPTKSAYDLAGSFVSENLSNLFDLNVIDAGINGASVQHASIGLTILLAMLAWTLQRA